LRDRISGVYCDGGLPLYDGLADAIKRLRARTTDQPASVVVLTAAKSDKSSSSLADLRAQAQVREGRQIRFYPVVLGRTTGADATEPARALQELAELTGGRCCDAGPDDLESKLRQLGRTLGAGDSR
jgi:hypothetical protein